MNLPWLLGRKTSLAAVTQSSPQSYATSSYWSQPEPAFRLYQSNPCPGAALSRPWEEAESSPRSPPRGAGCFFSCFDNAGSMQWGSANNCPQSSSCMQSQPFAFGLLLYLVGLLSNSI